MEALESCVGSGKGRSIPSGLASSLIPVHLASPCLSTTVCVPGILVVMKGSQLVRTDEDRRPLHSPPSSRFHAKIDFGDDTERSEPQACGAPHS